MKNTKRKGFTIVELVIVIAVIAILAAVLIPTFASLVNKANQSKDTQLVKNLNTALASDAKEHKTMSEALAAAEAFGYDVAKINASATGNEILWDSANDVFCYLNDGEIEYIPDSIKGEEPAKYKYWQICNDASKIGEYSIYWVGENAQELSLTVGFDAGQTSGHTLTFTGTNANIYTNGGTLGVNNSSADVNHYGFANEVKVTECANASYHEFGKVVKMTITKGHVEIESGALISEIKSVGAGSVTNTKGGYIINVPAGSNIPQGEKTSFSLEIATAADLASFRDSVNSGMTYEGLTVKLTADIDLGNQNWLPIGSYRNSKQPTFNGVFDGQGHAISNLFIDATADIYKEYREKDGDDAYGSSYAALFGYIDGATVKNFTVDGVVTGSDVAAVVGLCKGATIYGVTNYADVYGKKGQAENDTTKAMEGRGKVAGICIGPEGVTTIENCVNAGDITSIYDPAGGIVSFPRGVVGSTLNIKNCTNTGNVKNIDTNTSRMGAGGIIGLSNSDKHTVTVSSCTNTGDISAGYAGGIVGYAGKGTCKVDNNCQNVGKLSSEINGGSTGALIGKEEKTPTNN